MTAGVRALQRMRGLKAEGGTRGDFYVPPAPINALFSGALAVEAALIKAGLNMPIGSSVLCLARKIDISTRRHKDTKNFVLKEKQNSVSPCLRVEIEKIREESVTARRM